MAVPKRKVSSACLEAERPGSGKVPQVRGVHHASQSLRQLRILQWTGRSEERGLISTFRGGIEKEESFSIFLYRGAEGADCFFRF